MNWIDIKGYIFFLSIFKALEVEFVEKTAIQIQVIKVITLSHQ